MGVKVQSRVKISKTNLQAIGVRGSVYQARDGNTKIGISKEADAESRKHIEKDKRSDSGCHGKVKSPGKLSHIVRLLHLGQNATGSINMAWGGPLCRIPTGTTVSVGFVTFLLLYDPNMHVNLSGPVFQLPCRILT